MCVFNVKKKKRVYFEWYKVKKTKFHLKLLVILEQTINAI
jgi:hypothetical protein